MKIHFPGCFALNQKFSLFQKYNWKLPLNWKMYCTSYLIFLCWNHISWLHHCFIASHPIQHKHFSFYENISIRTWSLKMSISSRGWIKDTQFWGNQSNHGRTPNFLSPFRQEYSLNVIYPGFWLLIKRWWCIIFASSATFYSRKGLCILSDSSNVLLEHILKV